MLWTLSPNHERFRDMMDDQGDLESKTMAVIGQSPYQVTQCGDMLHVTRYRDAVLVISLVWNSELDIFNVVLNHSILPLSGRSHTCKCITGGTQMIDTSLLYQLNRAETRN